MRRQRRVFLAAAVCLWAATASLAQPPKPATKGAQPSAPGKSDFAVCLGADGSLVAREGPGKPWHPFKRGQAARPEELLLALPFTELRMRSGVQLQMLADLEGRSPYPIIETALVLHDNPKADLDFTLDRGRVTLTNTRPDNKPATIFARFRDQTWTIRLLQPKASVGLEIYGRWPRGVPFTPNPTPKDVPTLDAVLLVIAGEADLRVGNQQYLMRAPPGRALFNWDSVTGPDPAPQTLKELPAWAHAVDLAATPELRQRQEGVNRFRELFLTKSLDAALDEFSASDTANRRRFAIYAMGALDQLPRLGRTLLESKHSEDWDNAVVAMRHWLGRGPGQDMKLYHFLTDERKATPAQATTVLQLLHSFSDDERHRPELYDLLIEYLHSERFGIRGLAHWHLQRLVPEGKAIPFNPNGSKEEIEAAYEAWKKLIPSGQLPPAQRAKVK